MVGLNGGGGGVRRAPMRRRLAAVIAVFMALVLEPLFFALDPLSIGGATQQASADITARVMAPMYGYDAKDEDNVHAATKQIAVVLINEKTAEALGVAWPFPYGTQLQIYRRILRYEPRAVFLDLLYQFDRGGLDGFARTLADYGRRQTLAGQFGLTVGGSGAPTSGIVASVLGRAVRYGQNDALPVVQTNFEPGVVGMREVGRTYSLVEMHQGYSLREGVPEQWPEARPTPTGALRLMEMHCAVGQKLIERAGAAAPPLPPGCGDLTELLASPDRTTMTLQWGMLTQQTWEPTGDLSRKVAGSREAQIDLIRKENERTAGTEECRHFAPDLYSRLKESFWQAVWSLRPFVDFQRDKLCPYILTIPAEYLYTDQEKSIDYLRRSLAGKTVIVGASVAGATDSIQFLSRTGIGVYAHAMALDNLLTYGAAYQRDPPLIQGSLFWLELKWLKLNQDQFINIGVIFILLMLYFAIRRPLDRFIIRSPRWRWPRRMLVLTLWMLLAGGVTLATLYTALVIWPWAPFNWVAPVATAFIAMRLARQYDETIEGESE